MLKIPRKSSEAPSDLHRLLTSYIQNHYEEDPAKYSNSIQEFADLRSSMLTVEADLQGKDLIFKYFSQLEFFGAHFNLDEQQLPLKFVWKDAFNGDKVGQVSLAYEKACVIFNMAACVSQMATAQNRLEDTGLKTAFNYYQCAGGVFQYIADNFLHSPTTDLSKECILFFSELMLAQAQEVFCEKAAMDKKKTAMLAKLLQQCCQMYHHLTELASQKPLSGHLPAAFSQTIQWKAKYLLSLVNYYQSTQNEADGRFGEQVARLELADNCAKDCIKIAKDFSGGIQSSDTISKYLTISSSVLINTLSLDPQASTKAFSAEGTTGKRAGQILMEIAKAHQSFIENVRTKAAKENDIIYHDTVPKPDQLPAVDKINMTKTMKMTELFPNINSVVGADLFQSLIPMAVHEKSSVYSEVKSELIRSETAKVTETEESLAGILASYNYPQFLIRLKGILSTQSVSNSSNGVAVEGAPKEVLEWSSYIVSAERSAPLTSLFTEIETVRSKIRMDLERVRFLISEEQKEFDAMKEKHGDRWTQTPSSTACFTLQNEMGNHQRDLNRGAEGDAVLSGKLASYQPQWDLLKSPDRLNQHYIHGSLTVIDRKASSTLANTANLIDLPIDSMTTGGPDPAAIIKRIEDTVAKLNQLQRTRKTILNDLKERVQRDDISKALLNSRKPQEVVIKEELAKFEGDRHKIQQTIQEQHALMKSMERDHDALTGTNILGELEKLTQARSNITQSLKDSRVAYDGLRTNLQQGLSFYKELTKCTEKLAERTQRLMDERKQEREKQQAGLADSDAKLLADKLSKLSTSAPSPAAPPLAASAPVYVPTTQGYPPPPQQQHQSAPPPQTPYYYGQPQMPPPQQPLYQHQAYYGAPPAPTTASTASYTQPSGLPASLGNSLSLPAHLQQPLAPVQQSQPAQMQQQQPPYAAPYQQAWPPGGSMQQPPYAVPQYPQQPYMPGYPPPPAQQQPYYYNPQGGPPPQQQQQQPLPQSRPPQNHSLI